MIICSQNLYGLVYFEDFEPIDYLFLGIHGNGIAEKEDVIWVADYKDVLLFRKGDHKIIGKLSEKGYDNIHTLSFDGANLLVASTGNNTAFVNSDILLEFPQNHYLNSLIPWENKYLIGLRNPKVMLIYDKKEQKVEKEVHLPFLNNMHSPTHYKDDLFLVSDGDGVVLFNMEGKVIRKSPPMNWPRGIKVVDELAYVVDRNCLYEYDVENNYIVRKAENPIRKAVFGAFFDLVIT